MSRTRIHQPALALFAVLSALLLLPMGAAGGIPGHPQSDAYEHLHGYAWVSRSIESGQLPWENTTFGLPVPGVLWFPDTLGALLTLPISLLGGAPLAYTFAVFGQIWFAGFCGYLLGFHVSESRAAGVFAGVAFGVSPFVLGLVHSGVSEYLHLAAFPLLWLATDRAFSQGGKALVPAALVWAWLGWANAYYAMFGAFVPILVGLSRPDVTLGVLVRRAAAIAGLAGVLILPAALIINASLSASDAVLRQDSAPGWNWVFLPANDLAGFVWPGDHLFPDFGDRGNFGIRHVHYLGWVALLLAALAWRRWWRPLLLAGVVALGPSLHWRGQPVRVAGQVVPLPAALLYFPGSPFRAVHHPYRLVVLPLLVMAAAAADALRRRPRLALAAASLALGETLLASPGRWPVSWAPLTGVPELPGAGGVWDFPADFRALNRKWMGLQAVHGRPIPYTINVFLPAPWRTNSLYQSAMGCLERPDQATVSRDGWPPLAAWLVHDSTATLEEGITEVRGWGLRYVVVHLDALRPDEAACIAALLSEAAPVPQADANLQVFDLDPLVRSVY